MAADRRGHTRTPLADCVGHDGTVLDEDDVSRAAAVLRSGGTVVLPTDTVYGLAALPGGEGRLAELKGRPAEMPVAVLVASIEQARSVTGPWSREAERLAAEHWPGPLTLVLPGPMPGVPTVGVRWPDDAFVVALATAVGPLATTSANRPGEPTPPAAPDAAAALVAPPDLVLDGGPCGGVPSSVVDVTGREPVVLREGALAADLLFSRR
jgi:L-threonylcarbamoyladenylate synthase